MSENKGDYLTPKVENPSETIVLRENFNRIKEKIERPGENKPKVDIPDYGLKQLEILNNSLDSLKGESEEKGIYVIVRCWNKKIETIIKKNEAGKELRIPGLRDLAENLKRIKKEIPELKGVYLVDNKEGEEEANGKTIENLQKFLEEDKELPIVPVIVTNYTWTSGLNGPIAIQEQLMKEKEIDPKKVMMLFYSFDVAVPDEELKKLKDSIDKGNRFFLTFRLDPGGVHPLAKGTRFDTKEPTYKDLLDRYKTLTKAPYEADIDDLVSTNRNTFNLIYSDFLFDYGGFNPLCNDNQFKIVEPRNGNSLGAEKEKARFYKIPGMEDIDLFTRILKNAERYYKNKEGDVQKKAEGLEILLAFRRALRVPIKYRDKSWENRNLRDIIRKIAAEGGAYIKILDLPLNPIIKESKSEDIREVIQSENREVIKEIGDFNLGNI